LTTSMLKQSIYLAHLNSELFSTIICPSILFCYFDVSH
jgi:hypothetical protein